MAIDMATLQEEKVLLQKDFEEMKNDVKKIGNLRKPKNIKKRHNTSTHVPKPSTLTTIEEEKSLVNHQEAKP